MLSHNADRAYRMYYNNDDSCPKHHRFNVELITPRV
jgi:hypothetical protein